jgi:hypothetical protein
MSWRIINEPDILNQLSGAELESLRSAALGMGQADPVQPSIDDVTAEVRGYIAANSKNELDADPDKLPDRLIAAAVSLTIIQIMTRAAGTMIDPQGARQKRADEARRLLRDVASGNFSITDPLSGKESNEMPMPIYKPRRRRTTTRTQQDGL